MNFKQRSRIICCEVGEAGKAKFYFQIGLMPGKLKYSLLNRNFSFFISRKYPVMYLQPECFLDTSSTCNLEQIVDFSIKGSNTLEIVATNRLNLINKYSPTIGLSDHETSILLDINCQIYMWN